MSKIGIFMADGCEEIDRASEPGKTEVFPAFAGA